MHRSRSRRPPPRRAPRIALYSHDTQGMGHLRRNLSIARALAEVLDPAPQVLLVAGARELSCFSLPPGADALVLPGIAKDAAGTYRPRALGGDLARLLDLRAAILHAGLRAFDPDLLIVDKVPGGVGGELVPALEALRDTGRVHTALGLRDVLDESAAAHRDWVAWDATRLVERCYDSVWVYGDPQVHDVLGACDLPLSVRTKAVFTGYLGRPVPGAATRDLVVCTVGGGQDGAALAEAFVATTLPDGLRGLLITGPHMPPAERARIEAVAAGRSDLEVTTFVEGCEAAIGRAARVVAMAGYNTVVEVLAAGVPALLVPRIRPRREQQVRAEHLAAVGAVDVLQPGALSAAALGRWLARPPAPHAAAVPVDLDGLRRVAALARAATADLTRPIHDDEEVLRDAIA